MYQSKKTPLVICNHMEHPTGVYGCFRCIDTELLKILSSMTDKNEVEVFSVTTKLEGGRHNIVKGDKVPNAKLFFNFLHEKNICFKIFFTEDAFIKEYNNIKILKTIPIVINEDGREQAVAVGEQAVAVGEQAVAVGEQAVAVGEEQGEQPNFLQKFTTYYEYPYRDAAGLQQSCAFILEFLDNVDILEKGFPLGSKRISTKKLYIVLNKFCNNEMTREQQLYPKFKGEILDALKILNSYGYRHADTHLKNVVDCGKSQPQYKLIDFGNMEKISIDLQKYYKHANSDKSFFTRQIDKVVDEKFKEEWPRIQAQQKAAAEAEAAAAKAQAAAEAQAARAQTLALGNDVSLSRPTLNPHGSEDRKQQFARRLRKNLHNLGGDDIYTGGGKRTKKRKQKRSTNKKRRINKKRGRMSKRR
jgi:hypothetical protein